MKSLCLFVLAAIYLCCGKPADPVASMKDGIEAALINKNWIGKVDGQAVILTFDKKDRGLSANMQYTYFSRPGVMEDMTVGITDSGTIELTGTRHKRLAGTGGFALDTLVGKLSADSTVISGHSRSAIGGEWSVSRTATIEEVDPTLDIAKMEDILIKGKWQGRMGQKPASIKFTMKSGKLNALFTFGNRSVSATAELQDDGMIIMKAQERPTAQGLVSESFEGQLTRDLSILHGSYEHSVKQGFVEQSSGDNWAVQDVSKK
jgi:hypothetical protein